MRVSRDVVFDKLASWYLPQSPTLIHTIPNSEDEDSEAELHLNEEEIKALALLSSLSSSWEVFCTMLTNRSPKLTLDEAIGTILSKDIWHKSMGLTIDNNVEAHFSAQRSSKKFSCGLDLLRH